MSEDKATLRPWCVDEDAPVHVYSGTRQVCDCNSNGMGGDRKNAAHIVKCVNAHEALVAVCKQVLLETGPDRFGDGEPRFNEQIRAALKKAEGGEK